MRNRKTLIIVIVTILLIIAGIIFGINYTKEDIEKISESIEIEVEKDEEVIVSEKTEEIVEETIQATEKGEDISTTEIIESSEEEEETLEEEMLEKDAQVEQENISYDGTNTGDGLSLLGAYQGLTYYSQADTRWADELYTSTNNSSQTMKSSACGPTSAAIVVSSSKGAILPTTLAQLAVDNGYRTASNGTAWSYFSFVADYFDFEEFYTTYNFTTAMNYLKADKDNDGNADYYVVVSCGSGLFTTGGHYIVLVANTDETITVYDPYLYSGKFTTASRKSAGVTVSGNSAYVSETSFKTYANYKCFWVFSNDNGEGNTNTSSGSSNSTTNVSYTRYVSTSSLKLNVRTGAGMSYSVKTSLAKGTEVTVTNISGNWSYITSPVAGWVSSSYLSSTKVTEKASSSTSYSTTIGSYYKLKSKTKLYSKGSLSGTTYTYLAKTQIKVISHYSSEVDYIYIPATNRYAYCPVSAFTGTTTISTTSSSSSYTTGTYKVTASLLNVLSGPGTKYSTKKYSQLTANARAQNKALGNYYANGYLKGVVCTVTQVKGDWGKTLSGWIYLKDCTKI